MRRIFSCLLSVILLSACSLKPVPQPAEQQDSGLQGKNIQVEVSNGVFVDLPKPVQLQQTLSVSQLISAQWGQKQQHKLLVQLQVDDQQVVLAGFSSWGTRILSLNYADNQIQTYVMAGLVDTLPKPEQVLFNVMLSIWPVEAWTASFQPIGWRLLENDLQRVLINDHGQVVVEINYQKKPYLSGLITFKHLLLDYQINIETNSES
ncbi:DUF3261 domain-containing protein [Psychromonas sp.]|uniref:DUF3261 domain-containing protein n=1 Tax=Psychromonas sp. TaxID=1884585 RepID=UPI00356B4E1A